MSFAFSTGTFRDDYGFRNSAEGIARFPFPFTEERYMYSVNVEPHVPGPKGSAFEHPFDIDEHYLAEMAERDLVLRRDPLRCQSMPHMIQAEWDLVELVMTALARDYPQWFHLARRGDDWHWTNRPMAIDQRFTFGDAASLPCPPLEYIGRQVQGDFTLLDQREDNLWLDAGILTSQGKWSLDFDLGMNFIEWHAPVPLAHGLGVFERALKFLLALRLDGPVRRLNWSICVNPRLDTSLESYPEWGPEHFAVTPETVGHMLQLRVELQSLYRLPRSNAVAFSIRCYLISLDELRTNPAWAARFAAVLRDLHPDLLRYKALAPYRDMIIDRLTRDLT
ncbi:DUF3445 domain-containing protein [Zavarzinia sp.]|uniref:heme-dependent oxidative N-demethylase family protein n=1 Tax=Zavarzinia sp. TaxID=2027920 RepID=UPI0035613160